MYQMYHIGVAWRGEVRENGQVRMIHHLREPWPVKVSTQLVPRSASHASSNEGCQQPLASREILVRASMASMAQV